MLSIKAVKIIHWIPVIGIRILASPRKDRAHARRMDLRIIKMLNGLAALASAGLILQMDSAVAVDSTGVAHALARGLPSSASPVRSAQSAFDSRSEGQDYSPVLDAQQRAHELLAGTRKIVTPSSRPPQSAEVERDDRPVMHSSPRGI